jgi:D-beta-D-heptose 7-phosphate kinase/D-beta-D-heptose 1-phosphate adenosyltransferase
MDARRNPLTLDWTGRAPRILVLGDVMLDRALIGGCERISPEAPVQVVDVRESRRQLGGAGNVVRNCLALGAKAWLASVIGDDTTAAEVRALLTACGAGDQSVFTETDRRTTEKTRVFAAHQQVVRLDSEVRTEITRASEEQLLDCLQAAGPLDALIISDYAKGVVTARLCRAAIDWARSRGLPVFCDPKGRDFTKYAGASVLTPNRREAADAVGYPLSDAATIERAGRQLRETLALEHCLITLGEDGMALFSAGGEHRLPSRAREVFDITGAGDTVVATLAVACAAGNDVRRACEIANIAAGLKVAKLGAATVSRDELAAELARGPHGMPPSAKIKTRDEISRIAAAARAAGRLLVFTNGCFDILHRGHTELLHAAADMGDVLIVGLNSDRSVAGLKGPDRPLMTEDDRAHLLAALAAVDYVVLFDEETPLKLIEAVAPDVLVKGGDYAPDAIVGADLVRTRGGQVRVVPLVAGRSTSALVRRLTQ